MNLQMICPGQEILCTIFFNFLVEPVFKINHPPNYLRTISTGGCQLKRLTETILALTCTTFIGIYCLQTKHSMFGLLSTNGIIGPWDRKYGMNAEATETIRAAIGF